jgi:hypothetical protein
MRPEYENGGFEYLIKWKEFSDKKPLALHSLDRNHVCQGTV